MKILIAVMVVVMCAVSATFSQKCIDDAKMVSPVLSVEAQKVYKTKLEEARKQSEKTPNDADAIIWLGRRTAYLGDYKEAIKIFTQGIVKYPKDARLYRHRGHRFITLRCFDGAIKDFETAAKLIKGKPDEVEPDGLPNAKNIPTSTLQSNIWYHLGLAYYLKGDFKKALKAYKECEKVSKNPDMLVATKHWLYMTLRRLGKRDEAQQAIEAIPSNLNIIENGDYYTLIKLYQGKASGQKLLDEFAASADTLSKASLGYGLGNRYLYHDRKPEAMDIFRKITAGNQWASFGYIAAEAELKR